MDGNLNISIKKYVDWEIDNFNSKNIKIPIKKSTKNSQKYDINQKIEFFYSKNMPIPTKKKDNSGPNFD